MSLILLERRDTIAIVRESRQNSFASLFATKDMRQGTRAFITITLMPAFASPILRKYCESLSTCVDGALEKVLRPVTYEGQLNGKGFRFAIVASRWNDFISSRLVEGALDALARLGVAENSVAVYRVPGSYEIPLLALKVAGSMKFDAVICLGTIIRGQTPHFEYVANEVTRGISQAGMETGVPVVFGIITADNLDQAIDRAGVKLGNKGFEAATTAVELVNLYKEAFRE